MNPRRAISCLVLTVCCLLLVLGGGFVGCSSDDSGTSIADASATDATTESGSCSAPNVVCAGSCVSTQTDESNCGACGKACGTGNDCEDGACVPSCLSMQTKCSGRCVALETDNVNCGSCGVTCGAGKVCNGGTCDVTCAAPLTICGATSEAGTSGDAGSGTVSDGGADGSTDAGDAAASDSGPITTADASAPAGLYCARVDSDEANCGGCGITCGTGQQCGQGVCGATCAIGEQLCGNSGCRDLSTDLANCGACGKGCVAGQVCSGGVCQATCGLPFTQCGSACANTASDPAHCGACGTSCAPENAKAAACVSGSCSFVGCQSGFADCDGNAINGCERPVSSDITSCGACGNHCNAAHVVANVCTGGSCGFNGCQSGFGDCDGDVANGCETDLTSAANCGTCGNVCTNGACGSSGCTFATASYFLPDYGPAVTMPARIDWTIATAAPSSIFYTLDGTTPTTTSPHGASPLKLTNVAPTDGSTTVVKWFIFNGATSPVQTRTITTSSALQGTKLWAIGTDVQLGVSSVLGPGGPVLAVQAGQTVTGTFNLQVADPCATGTCASDVAVAGLDSPSSCLSFSAGPWPGRTAATNFFQVVVPDTNGTFPVQLGAGEPTCEAAETSQASAFSARSATIIGYLIVTVPH